MRLEVSLSVSVTECVYERGEMESRESRREMEHIE